jgi:streptomycin 6-kinase
MAFDDFAPWIERWHLVVDGAPFVTRFGSRLLPVLAEGAPAILKVTHQAEELRGGALMEWFDGAGAARVFGREGPALLLERAVGRRNLAEMARSGQDDEATRVLCRTAMALHAPRPQPPPASLVPLGDWFRALPVAAARHGGAFATAAAAAEVLLSDPQDPVVLHGDFHHENVLDGGPRGWLVIDPKGLLGERGFEYANLFRNPDVGVALARGRMARRVEIVAEEARLPRERLLRWVLAYAGLGAAWSLESGDDPGPGLAIAELAAALLAG